MAEVGGEEGQGEEGKEKGREGSEDGEKDLCKTRDRPHGWEQRTLVVNIYYVHIYFII